MWIYGTREVGDRLNSGNCGRCRYFRVFPGWMGGTSLLGNILLQVVIVLVVGIRFSLLLHGLGFYLVLQTITSFVEKRTRKISALGSPTSSR